MIGKDSRYASCVLYRDGDGESLGTRQRIDATPRYDDRFHTVTDGERLDIIAHRYLGDAKLWWIICDYLQEKYGMQVVSPQQLSEMLKYRLPVWCICRFLSKFSFRPKGID